MVLLDVDGLAVDFPYEPYECQRLYMSAVIKSLKNGWNAALESPTGTGKTLCLLCATLTWMQWHNARTAAADGPDGPDGAQLPGGSGRVRVYYASRTHSQLAQVVREFNKTAYQSTVKLAVIGSREQFCLNPAVANETNAAVKNQLCRVQVKARKCKWYNGYDKKFTGNPGDVAPSCSGGGGGGADIEDLMTMGRRESVCPYYASRALFDTADLVLLPYNYVLDPQSRYANKIRLDSSVLIFDEAHNVLSLCEQAVSVSLSSRQVAGAIREARGALQQLVEDEQNAREMADASTSAFGALDLPTSSDKNKVNIDQNDLASLIFKLSKVDQSMDGLLSAPPPPRTEASSSASKNMLSRLTGRVLPSDAVHRLLRQAEIEPAMAQAVDALANEVAQYLTGKGEENASGLLWSGRGEYLKHFASVVNVVYAQPPPTDGQLSSFSVYVCEEDKRQGDAAAAARPMVDGDKKSVCVNYWCLDAGVCMRSVCSAKYGSDMATAPVRSCLLTSGTLAPLKQFIYDIGIPVGATLESEHVIEPSRVWLGVMPTGPDLTVLDSSYKFRKDEAYVRSLGNAIINVCRVVPQGMLVFFASYAQLEYCVNGWKECTIWSSLCCRKSVLVEPRDKAAFVQVMVDFDAALRDGANAHGAVLLAVARGKVSEGIDFSDRQARCVLLAGIPYPPMYDARVCIKKHYLTQRYSKAAPSDKARLVDADTWYVQEAARAVNQAVGRAIRHRNDFGAVLLADRRFIRWDKSRLPKWLQPRLSVFDSFGPAQRSLAQFYRPLTTVCTALPLDCDPAKPAFDTTSAVLKPAGQTVRPVAADPVQAARAALYRKFDPTPADTAGCSTVASCYAACAASAAPPPAKRSRTDAPAAPLSAATVVSGRKALSALSALAAAERQQPAVAPIEPMTTLAAPVAHPPRPLPTASGACGASGRRRIKLVPQSSSRADDKPPAKGDIAAFILLIRERLPKEQCDALKLHLAGYKQSGDVEPLLKWLRIVARKETVPVIIELKKFVKKEHGSLLDDLVKKCGK